MLVISLFYSYHLPCPYELPKGQVGCTPFLVEETEAEMLHAQGSHRKEWLSLNPCKTWHDNGVYTTTWWWCPNTALQACLHGEYRFLGSISDLLSQHLHRWSLEICIAKCLPMDSHWCPISVGVAVTLRQTAGQGRDPGMNKYLHHVQPRKTYHPQVK